MEAVNVIPIKPELPKRGIANFDTERVLSALPEEFKKPFIKFDLSLLQRLPHLLRSRELFYGILIKEEKGLLFFRFEKGKA